MTNHQINLYNQLIQVIGLLPSSGNFQVKILFEITEDWCRAQGISATGVDVKVLGKEFINDYKNYGCDLANEGTDEHHLYIKL